ncbi:MAG: glycosyltransferase [Candidatus Omnitrophota bacterium]
MKVLLMYITEVSGHHQASKAIEKALKDLDPSVETSRVNGFEFAYPIIEKIINKAYMGVIKRTPKIWDYLYDNPKIVKRTQSIKEAIHKSKHEKLAKLFGQFQPDAVICTQAFPCGLFADFKKTYRLKTTLIGVLTDHAPHSYWLNDSVDYFIVPSQEARERFLKEGIPQERIKLFGIPIDPKFTKTLDRDAIVSDLGLDPAIPTILIMGGGQGLGPIKNIVKSLNKIETAFQLIVVAGTNKKLIKWLKKIHFKSPRKILIFEYADNIDELMEVSTLAVTKAGGLTTAESLAKGLPLVIVKPIPGQEERNTDFFIKNGMAVRVNHVKDVGQEIDILLKTPERLLAMRQAALDKSRTHASYDIAKLVLSNVSPVYV